MELEFFNARARMKQLVIVLCIMFIFSLGNTVHAESESAQLEQIQALLAKIEELQAQLATLRGKTEKTGACLSLSRSLYLGVSDSETLGEVSKLQRFLTSTGHYTYGEITGFFGPATQSAVQAWQAANGIVTSGSPETTGYGLIGPSTRTALTRGCATKPIVTPTKDEEELAVSVTSVSNSENPTVRGKAYGTNIVGFSVSDGGKVYGSGDIQVVDNQWKHKISTDLEDGRYTLVVYVDDTEVARKSFTINTEEDVEESESSTPNSPTVDLKISGGDGPLSRQSGSVTFSWTSTNADYCTASGDTVNWSGSKSTNGSETVWIGNEKTGVTTYTLTCGVSSGKLNPASDSVTVTFNTPTVDFKINGTDGPLTKGSGTATFTWVSSNTDYCTASGDTYWSGSKSTNGSETVWTGNEKTGVTTYTMTCGVSSGKVGSVKDSVTVYFQSKATITDIQAKASNDSVLYAGEKAYIYGTGLKGDLTIKLGNTEPKYVKVTSASDTYVEFTVPEYTQTIDVAIRVTNASGVASDPFSVRVIK